MLKTFRKGILTAAAAVLGAALLGGCGSGTRASDGLVHLNFQIWDNAQRGGMEAVARAYMDKNPEVEIQVQVTSWDEYWTKLDAAAESGQLPDIFWMHTNQILKYADYGKLEDVTDLYDDVEPDYYTSHFSDISLANARGSDGRMYGVPKDKDTVCLVYNKEMLRQGWLTLMSPGRGMTLHRLRLRFMKEPENTDIWHMRMSSWDTGISYTRQGDTY